MEHAHARAACTRDGSFGRLIVAREYLEQCCFARAIGSNKAVTRAFAEFERSAFEEDAFAVRLAQVGRDDHREGCGIADG
jgi:hypothetical protein